MSLGCSQLPRPMVIPSLDILIVFAQAADPRNPPWIASHPGGFWPGRRSSRSIGDSPSLGSADHCNIERVAKGGVGEGGRNWRRPIGEEDGGGLGGLLAIPLIVVTDRFEAWGYRWISRLPRVLDFL